ncbi:MAG: two-component system C4-dicarboxylate transport response regulator DctD [Oceanospirillaceae bacterium]|jgi:two-component system C4-dicarboxylate transport response regulator DctD
MSTDMVIVIDDEEIVRQFMLQTLQIEGYNAQAFEDPLLALAQCSKTWQGVVICDVRMNLMDGLEVLRKVMEIDTEIPVIMFSAHADIAVAIQAIRMGAYDFLEKTDDPQHHLNTVQRAWKKRQLVLENRNLRQAIDGQHEIDKRLVGQSVVMQRLREMVLQLAQVDVDAVINGATGTGKEVVAKCLHDFSDRAKKPFVALNCGALAESVIESELFGHEAGAFTGAVKKRIGKIEYASGGTLFLDEIESMPPSLQVRLLRVLQERTLQRLGGNQDITIDIRVIAASKVDLLAAANKGEFREDLYYRLNVACIEIPTLEQRKEDIALLFNHFLELACLRFAREHRAISHAQLQQLSLKPWPGNVRELRNAAERWVLGLPLEIEMVNAAEHQTIDKRLNEELDASFDEGLDESIDRFERDLIIRTLKSCEGHIEQSAQALKIPRKKLYLRMKKHGLERQHYMIE